MSHNPITPKQHSFLLSLLQQHGKEKLREIRRKLNIYTPIAHLSSKQAWQIIREFTEEKEEM